jgi:hypothetical protein
MNYTDINRTLELKEPKFLNAFLEAGWRIIGTRQVEGLPNKFDTFYTVATDNSELPAAYAKHIKILEEVNSGR